MANRKDSKGRVLKTGESQRKDGTYMYRYTDIRGKRQSVYAPDLKKLREKENVIQKDIYDGIDYTAGNITVIDLVDKYLSTKENVIRESTMTRYRSYLCLIKKYDFGYMKIRDVRSADAKQWVIQIHNNGRKIGSIRPIIAIMKPAFKLAYDDGCIKRNPFDFKISSVIENDSIQRVPLTMAQQISLLDFIDNSIWYDRYYDMFNVLLWTGLRIGEYCGLTVDDIDFKNRTIRINKQLSSGVDYNIHIEKPKTKAGNRLIPITGKTYNSLKRLVDQSRKSNIINMVDGYSGFIATKPNGKIQTYIDIIRVFARIKAAYNKANPDNQIEQLTPHILRHTFCTNMVASGLDVKSLQYIMGHLSANVTLNVYTHNSYENVSTAFLNLIDGKGAV